MLKKLREIPIRTHFHIRTGLISIGLVIALIARPAARDGRNALMWVGLILMLSGMIWHILFIRCPHCGSAFRLRGGIPRYCPECGKYIDKFH